MTTIRALGADVNTNAFDLYASLPLPPSLTCIRVLDVLADTAPGDDGPLCGNLRVLDLELRPKVQFSALSYVWGVDLTPCTIACGNATIDISRNCFSCLLHLRRKLGKFTIWVDAICINQKDDREKERQIPLMGCIYSNADTTYVWLGEGNERSDRAMTYLSGVRFVDFFSPTNPRVWAAFWNLFTSSMGLTKDVYLVENERKNWVRRLIPRLGLERIPRAAYASLDDLKDVLSREWLERMWTYQEILLASNPVIVCGNSHIQWSRLASVLVALHFDDTIESCIPKFPVWSKLVVGRIRLQQTNRTSSHSQGKEMRFYQAYQLFVMRVARYYGTAMTLLLQFQVVLFIAAIIVPSSLAYNRGYMLLATTIIFLLFSLLVIGYWMRYFRPKFRPPFSSDAYAQISESRIKTPITENLIHGTISRKAQEPKDKAFALHAILQRSLTEKLPNPDYNLSTGHVYKSYCRYLIDATNSLDILVPAAWKGYSDQPSWVPDWNQGSLDLWQNDQLLLPVSKPYWKWDLAEDRGILKVRGLHISDISSCFKLQKTSDTYLEEERSIHCENLAKILALFSRHHPYNNKFSQTTFTVRGDSLGLLNLWQEFFYYKASKTPLEVLSLLTGSAFLRYTTIDWIFVSYKSILKTHISICNELAETNRMFFAAEKVNTRIHFSDPQKLEHRTEFLDGICKGDVQVGDKVIYISGLSSLVIVRAYDSESVRLVSPAVMGLKHKPGDLYTFDPGINLRPNVKERDLEEFALA